MVVVGVDAPLSPPPAMAALLPLLLRAANAVSYNGRRVVGLIVVELELVVVLGRVGGDGTSGVVVVAGISMDTSERFSVSSIHHRSSSTYPTPSCPCEHHCEHGVVDSALDAMSDRCSKRKRTVPS